MPLIIELKEPIMFDHHLSQRPACLGIRRIAAIAIMALIAPAIALANSDWSSVASTGTFDEICNNRARLTPNSVSLRGGNSASDCTIRYQVVDTWNGAAMIARRRLSAGFIDNGAYAHVAVRLVAYEFSTGNFTYVARMNSDSFPGAPTYQLRTGTSCVDLNFATHSYLVELELIRTVAPTPAMRGTPEIRHVRLAACP
jgi:hypothetical protein